MICKILAREASILLSVAARDQLFTKGTLDQFDTAMVKSVIEVLSNAIAGPAQEPTPAKDAEDTTKNAGTPPKNKNTSENDKKTRKPVVRSEVIAEIESILKKTPGLARTKIRLQIQKNTKRYYKDELIKEILESGPQFHSEEIQKDGDQPFTYWTMNSSVAI